MRRIFKPSFVQLVDVCMKEEVAAVPDVSVKGLTLDSVKAVIKNLVLPGPIEVKPKLGRWAVGCHAALSKKYT